MELEESNQIEEDLVIEYIQSNPDFLEQHPQLLAQLRLPKSNNGTVSLVERQKQVLRDKVAVLQEEITDLMVVARQNEKIYQVFVELYIELLNCDSVSDVENCLANIFSHDLQMSATKLKLFDENAADKNYVLAPLGQKALQENRLAKQSYYMGRLNQTESQWLFDSSDDIASVALIRLGSDDGFGLLAIASDKDEHFQPQMDTLFIGQLQRLLGLVIPKLLN
jgi:uncharacterized protein YigA (DUF484 family)